jgi:RHS repeat-associated protein
VILERSVRTRYFNRLMLQELDKNEGVEHSYAYFYDANGNVGQLIDLFDGSVDAKYEYDPYGGNLLDPDDPNETGPYAAENPFRFSTKYFDAETALGYWGYRYYSPRLGRWLRPDPIGISGGPNARAFSGNSPTDRIDPIGLDPEGTSDEEDRRAVTDWWSRVYPGFDSSAPPGSMRNPYANSDEACQGACDKLREWGRKECEKRNMLHCERHYYQESYGGRRRQCDCPYEYKEHYCKCYYIPWIYGGSWHVDELAGVVRAPAFDISSGVGNPRTGFTQWHKAWKLIIKRWRVKKLTAVLGYACMPTRSECAPEKRPWTRAIDTNVWYKAGVIKTWDRIVHSGHYILPQTEEEAFGSLP